VTFAAGRVKFAAGGWHFQEGDICKMKRHKNNKLEKSATPSPNAPTMASSTYPTTGPQSLFDFAAAN